MTRLQKGHTRLAGCPLNGLDVTAMRDTCVRLYLNELKACSLALTTNKGSLTYREALHGFRSSLKCAENIADDDNGLRWRDRRMLRRILASARTLDACLPR